MATATYTIQIKRIYEEASPSDGYRMLVDRLWPRGISKERAHLDEWNKNIAPSTELRKWFGHQPELFEEFAEKYRAELNNKQIELQRIKEVSLHQNLTLLYAAKSEQINHAVVLLSLIKNS